jgi:putative ABC transport system permease protein
LLAYSVAGRTPEIGLRFALGAERRHILSLVVHEALRMVVPGAIIGVILSLFVARVVGALLYGISPQDPWTLTLALAVSLVTALVATLIPARRAAAITPMQALRTE